MLDFRLTEIHEGNTVVYIHNERTGQPRFIKAIVEMEVSKSIVVKLADGETKNLWLSHRSSVDGKMNNLVVIPSRPDIKGDLLDFTGYPICVADKVAFMEAPSQGFSTSLVEGNVLNISEDGITILVKAKTEHKYFRKPNEIVVIEHYGI